MNQKITCRGCGKPVLDGEARYAGREPDEHWHWRCHEMVARHFPPTNSGIAGAMERFRLVVEDVKRELGL